jgi:hypothetical protein
VLMEVLSRHIPGVTDVYCNKFDDPHPDYSCDQIKENEMGGACGTYERQERCIQGFGGET